MNEHDPAQLLDRLAETVKDDPAPLTAIISAARRAQRRRTSIRVAATAAAIALVAGSITGTQLLLSDDSRPSNPPAAVELPTAPVGMRLVGVGRVVVPLPDSWTPQDTTCQVRPTPGVFFTPLAGDQICLSDLTRGSYVRMGFIDTQTDTGRRVAALATQEGLIDSTPVLLGPACGRRNCPSSPWTELIVVPSEHLVVVVATVDDAPSLLDGLRVLPEGYTTVPYLPSFNTADSVRASLGSAGLRYRFAPGTGLAPGPLGPLRTDPPAGSVVTLGSTVTVLPETSPSQRCCPPRLEGLDDADQDRVRAILSGYLATHPGWSIEEVWARRENGRASQPGVGNCTSGELMKIEVFGTFPFVTTGVPATSTGVGDNAVTRVEMTADARTREVCSLGVSTGTQSPNPNDTKIEFLAADG